MELRRAAIVGCGPRAAEHVAAYRHVERGRLVAACSRTPGRAEAFCREHGIDQSYEDVDRMLEAERPDLLHLVTMPDQRVPLMALAAAREVPVVIVEKPIAIQGEDAREIAQLLGATSTQFVVNTQLHFHPRVVHLRRAVAEGRIGDVVLVDVSAGSTVSDQGVHLVELAHTFAGDAAPTWVFGQVAGAQELDSPQPSPDSIVAVIGFSSGVTAHMVTGDIAPVVAAAEPFYMQKRIAVYGTQGFVRWSMFGWDRNTTSEGYSSGTHDYFIEDELGQAALTDSAFALLEDDSEPHPTRAGRALVEFGVVLGLYLSALDRRRIALPHDPPDGLIASLRGSLSHEARPQLR